MNFNYRQLSDKKLHMTLFYQDPGRGSFNGEAAN
ncbi:Uncharacterised protein [Legionella birminghamensis]|uniref:Uncharacterized protein n=1 Tax=Legionella birminghamensis TaxID=28083 RepID=A0A378JSG1_9GAMM|nr:Uncharacterised protein [Legionella birminghamensis]